MKLLEILALLVGMILFIYDGLNANSTIKAFGDGVIFAVLAYQFINVSNINTLKK